MQSKRKFEKVSNKKRVGKRRMREKKVLFNI
jgi:hypothetical protein